MCRDKDPDVRDEKHLEPQFNPQSFPLPGVPEMAAGILATKTKLWDQGAGREGSQKNLSSVQFCVLGVLCNSVCSWGSICTSRMRIPSRLQAVCGRNGEHRKDGAKEGTRERVNEARKRPASG